MTKYDFNAKKIAADLGITTATIYKRIRDGWDIDDAISVGHIPQKERIYNHNKKYDANIKKAAEKLGLNENTIYLRLRKGWSLEKAISTPSQHGKKKNVCKPAPVKSKPIKIASCEKLNASLQRLNAAIDKLIQLKMVKKKIVLNENGTDLRKLIKKLPKLDEHERNQIDYLMGGYKCNILNRVNADKKEFKYNIIGINGKQLHTNNKIEFINFLRDEVA